MKLVVLIKVSCVTVTYLLLDLQRIHSRGKLAQNLISLLVELELSGDQIGQIAQGLGGIKDLNTSTLVVAFAERVNPRSSTQHTFFITLTASSV